MLAIVALTLMVTLAVPVRSWFAQRAQIAGLRADVEAARAYLDARTQGLCHEGALEVALGVRGSAGAVGERFIFDSCLR